MMTSDSPSAFSGQKYGDGNNGGGNTQKAYKSKCDIGTKSCGSGSGPNKNKKKMEKQLDGVAVVKADPKKYNSGKGPDYKQASVFKKK